MGFQSFITILLFVVRVVCVLSLVGLVVLMLVGGFITLGFYPLSYMCLIDKIGDTIDTNDDELPLQNRLALA